MKLSVILLLCGLLTVGIAQERTRTVLEEVQTLLNKARQQSQVQRERSLDQALQTLKSLSSPAFEPIRQRIEQARYTLDTDDIVRARQAVEMYLRWGRFESNPLKSDAVKKQLERIFSEPDMQIVEKTLWERLTDTLRTTFTRIVELINRMLGGLGRGWGAHASPIIQWLAIGVVVIAIALFASYLLSKIETRRVKSLPQQIITDLPEDIRVLSATEWHTLAQSKAQTGDYHLAVRALYMGVLRLLHEHRLLAYDPALTNWEHLERLRKPITSRPELLPLMTEAYHLLLSPTIAFDRIEYGGVPAHREDYLAIESVFETLQRNLQEKSHA